MDIRKLTDAVSVAPQISADDLPRLKEHGFRSVICNRPDSEEPGQPPFSQIAQAAQNLGMETRHIPVTGAAFSADQIADFRESLDTLPHPVLAYCRSGTRSTILWALSQSDKLSKADIVETARAAGYDIAGLLA